MIDSDDGRDRLLPMLAPEFRLLCLAVRPAPDREALRAAIAAGPDWAILLEGAERHRVAPLLLAALQPLTGSVPPEVREGLRRKVRGIAGRALAHAAALETLLPAFAEAGIRVLVLKGIVLSQQLYGDLVSRGAGDIDLLVASQDFRAADAVLRNAGCAPLGAPLPERGRIDGQHMPRDLSYWRNGIVVELHQRMTMNPHCLPTDFEALWRGRETVNIAGVAVDTLPRRFLPLYLCIHGSQHCWERLRWLVDLAHLFRKPDIAAHALEDAAQLGLRRPMKLSAALASGLLGVGASDATGAARRFCRRFFGDDRWLMRRGGRIAAFRRIAWMRFYNYTAKGTWAYACSELATELRNPVDRDTLPLPDRLRWLYPVLRPLAWTMRKLRGRQDAG